MKTLISVITLALVLACCAFGQTPMFSNLALAGAGVQPKAQSGGVQASGYYGICRKAPEISLWGLRVPNYGCLNTDYLGQASTGRLESIGVLFNASRFSGGWKLGGGAAANDNGYGASWTAGGWTAVHLGAGWFVSGSGTWQKDNVMALIQEKANLPAQLKDLGARGVYRLGVMKGWE